MDVEELLVDGRAQVRKALEDAAGGAYTVRARYSGSSDEGAVVTCCEYSNVNTDCPAVDAISYQVDIWAATREEAVRISQTVNSALRLLGLRREYAGPDTVSGDGSDYVQKTFRFGRKVDKRRMRLID